MMYGRNNMSNMSIVFIVVSLVISVLLLFTTPANAGNATAASCSAANIQAAINTVISSGGGTVSIPACQGGNNGSAWNNGDCVCAYSPTAELRIIGAGESATYIQYVSAAKPASSCSCGGHGTGSPSGAMFGLHGAGFKEWGNLTISGNDDDAMGGGGMEVGLFIHACEGTGMTNVRVHNSGFKRPVRYSGGILSICSNVNSAMVIDHNHIGYQNSTGTYGNYGMVVKGPNSDSFWTEPALMGRDNPNAVYIEDNVFDQTYHPVSGFGATRIVVRHNEFYHWTAGLEQHGTCCGTVSCCETLAGGGHPGNWCSGWGTDADPYVGNYRSEIYNNYWHGPGGEANLIRSGHWIVTGNTYENISGAIFDLGPDTGSYSPSTSNNGCTTANGCPTIAMGQVGTANGCYHLPRAIYFWGNTITGSNMSGCTTGNEANCFTTQHDQQCIRVDQEKFFRAPQAGDPIITSWTPYDYPHPLVTGQTITSWNVSASVSGGNGSLICASPVNNGATTSCSAAPLSGYFTSNISGCGGAWTSGNNYSTGAITANCTVTASFSLNGSGASKKTVPPPNPRFN
jgi:hypothetical protein